MAGALVVATMASQRSSAQTQGPESEVMTPAPVSVLRVCVMRASDVTDERVQEIREGLQRGADRHGVRVEIPWVREWSRSGFATEDSLISLMRVPLEAPCDRLLGLIGRHLGDFIANVAGFNVPIVLDRETSARAVIVANMDPVNSALRPPDRNAEFLTQAYLGCRLRLDIFQEECAQRVANLQRNVDPVADFVPGVTKKREFLTTREAVEAAVQKALDARARSRADR